MNNLLLNVRCLKNITYRKIMNRLIYIYKKECLYNEGNLTLNDLVTIYNLFYFLEEDEEC